MTIRSPNLKFQFVMMLTLSLCSFRDIGPCMLRTDILVEIVTAPVYMSGLFNS